MAKQQKQKLKIQEKIDELERLVYLHHYVNTKLPDGGPGFQNALASRNDFDE